MNLVNIYRISDNSNPEKIKPEYASKENCLKTFVREFSRENLIILCDNVTDETYEMVHKYTNKENIYRTQNGNTGSFIVSWNLAHQIAQTTVDDTIFYLVEDDYIHRRGSKEILIEAFRDLDASYVSLYDHPDKYQNNKDKRFVWGHGKVDEDVNGIRKPGIIYGTPSECKLYISKSSHWRTAESTTMTWATTGKHIKQDHKDMVKLHDGKNLPMGGDTFKMLKEKGKELITALPGYAGHAEERWLPYFINWQKESNMGNEIEDVWFEKLELQLKEVPVYDNPRRRKVMWENHVKGHTIDDGVILEFGVADGGSIGWFPKHIPDTAVYGFDSFLGLPEDWDLGDRVLEKGHFNIGGKAPLSKDGTDFSNITFIEGWFEDTLTPFLTKMKEKIKVLHIDSDLYSPCKYVLEKVKSRLVPGTFILFDELTHFSGHPQYKHMRVHEYKAFMEFCYDNPNFEFEVVARTTGPQVMIKVLSV